MELVDRLLAGDVRAVARAVSLVEQGSGQAAEIQRIVISREILAGL